MNFTKYISYKYSRRNKDMSTLNLMDHLTRLHCKILENFFMTSLQEGMRKHKGNHDLSYILDGAFVEAIMMAPKEFPAFRCGAIPIKVGVSRDNNCNFEVHINYELLEQDFADEYDNGTWRKPYDTNN